MSSELWLAEGFTSYYGGLVLARAEITSLDRLLGSLGRTISAVSTSPGARFRSAVDMSRLAPFVDAAQSVDRTYGANTFLSYYTHGAAIALGLDLTLRDRSDGAVTLDTFMRAMWERYGKPEGSEPPAVARPYDVEGARQVLVEVAGDAAFAEEFFSRHITGILRQHAPGDTVTVRYRRRDGSVDETRVTLGGAPGLEVVTLAARGSSRG